MASEDENDYHSDNEVNPKDHAKLLQDVFQLDKKTYVKKPTRTEPISQISEFNLVKTSSGKTSTVNIDDLTKSLDKKKKLSEVSKRVKSTQSKVKTLRQPLEKPQRERIKRSIGFKEVKEDLGKWDAIVTKNRVTSQLKFPLNEGDIKIHKGIKPAFQLTTKSKLDIELEKLDPPREPEPVIEKYPLTMKEILERRREMARLRAHQSYQEAKYHRQNKIKSKKFHRIQRKEKIKNQIKEFEQLQKTNPEAALEKLEELERARVEERMSLRHKSTGQWARSKQVRAKYDKESRQVLAEQLSIAKELTQKHHVASSSESEDDDVTQATPLDQSNPWLGGVKTDKEISDFVSGYRKFWDEKNKNKGENEGKSGVDKETMDTNDSSEDENVLKEFNSELKNSQIIETRSGGKYLNGDLKLDNVLGQKLSKKSKKKVKKNVVKCTTEWKVEEMEKKGSENESDVDEMFNDLEGIANKKIGDKISQMKTDLKPVAAPKGKTKQKPKPKKKEKNTTAFMEFPREKYRPELDEELVMDSDDEPKRVLSNVVLKEKKSTDSSSNIDPDKFINVKPTHLQSLFPDNILGGENDSDADDEQKAFISEAFAGDDVVADFTKEKKALVEGDKPQDVDLTLPGWGTWGGKDIKISKRKKRRFVVKFPKKMPRRDDNKGKLIINENKDEKLKKHLVSEVPFPFRSVKDFEASIRAPIGDTFVPQTAFRRLIKPAVVTKKGEVIKPMDTDVLVKNKFTKKGMVVKNR